MDGLIDNCCERERKRERERDRQTDRQTDRQDRDGTGQDRAGQGRAGQDRTGQDRTDRERGGERERDFAEEGMPGEKGKFLSLPSNVGSEGLIRSGASWLRTREESAVQLGLLKLDTVCQFCQNLNIFQTLHILVCMKA